MAFILLQAYIFWTTKIDAIKFSKSSMFTIKNVLCGREVDLDIPR